MTAAIILAAGNSSRLGFPKQTLLFKGKTLLEIAVEAALGSKCEPVIVVLGAAAEKIEPGLKDYKINIIHNPNWAEGMSSSIRSAINHINDLPDIDSALLMLCDQPFVNSRLLDSLLYKQQQANAPIVACTYRNTTGVPALFKRELFPELNKLQGQMGAKQLFQNHAAVIATIPFEKGGIDIDTLDDYENLINNT